MPRRKGRGGERVCESGSEGRERKQGDGGMSQTSDGIGKGEMSQEGTGLRSGRQGCASPG